jgi:hypothetical protein
MISSMHNDLEGGQAHSKGMAFLLWLTWLFGVGGLHRFYLGKPLSGLLYLCTWSFFGIGQFVDLFLMQGMVEDANNKHAALQALAEKRALRAVGIHPHLALPPAPATALVEADSPEKFRVKLVQAAARYNGKLSVTQGVMATGKTFEEVERALDEMVRSGYVDVTNDENTGVVIYNFGQLQADS